VPPRSIRELRDVTRQRVHLLEDLNRVKNRVEQLCQSGNIKVSSVATDLFGLSGRTMLKALVAGNRDPGWMADYAKGALRGKKRELELALDALTHASVEVSPPSSAGCWRKSYGKWNGLRRKCKCWSRRLSVE